MPTIDEKTGRWLIFAVCLLGIVGALLTNNQTSTVQATTYVSASTGTMPDLNLFPDDISLMEFGLIGLGLILLLALFAVAVPNFGNCIMQIGALVVIMLVGLAFVGAGLWVLIIHPLLQRIGIM